MNKEKNIKYIYKIKYKKYKIRKILKYKYKYITKHKVAIVMTNLKL